MDSSSLIHFIRSETRAWHHILNLYLKNRHLQAAWIPPFSPATTPSRAFDFLSAQRHSSESSAASCLTGEGKIQRGRLFLCGWADWDQTSWAWLDCGARCFYDQPRRGNGTDAWFPLVCKDSALGGTRRRSGVDRYKLTWHIFTFVSAMVMFIFDQFPWLLRPVNIIIMIWYIYILYIISYTIYMCAQYEKESESGSIIARNVYACFWQVILPFGAGVRLLSSPRPKYRLRNPWVNPNGLRHLSIVWFVLLWTASHLYITPLHLTSSDVLTVSSFFNVSWVTAAFATRAT